MENCERDLGYGFNNNKNSMEKEKSCYALLSELFAMKSSNADKYFLISPTLLSKIIFAAHI